MEITESTFYQWRKHQDDLEDASSRPKHHPQALPLDEVARVLTVCLKQPKWGGEKISQYLTNQGTTYVSAATANRIKKRLREAFGSKGLQFVQRYEFIQPNDAWATDILEFTWDDHKLYLIIVLDDHSRYILNWTVTTRTSFAVVKELLEEAFVSYGVPRLVKSDNGPEFRKQLKAFLNGYRSIHHPSPPYRPSYNGKVERKYRDIREFINDIPESATIEMVIGMIAQNIYEHNHVRPHQSLNGITPYQRYHGLDEQVRARVEQIKELTCQRRAQRTIRLTIPGQKRPTRPVKVIIPGHHEHEGPKGLIVPVSSTRDRQKRVGFVRQFLAS